MYDYDFKTQIKCTTVQTDAYRRNDAYWRMYTEFTLSWPAVKYY